MNHLICTKIQDGNISLSIPQEDKTQRILLAEYLDIHHKFQPISFKKLKERLLAFYRVLKAMGIPFTGINELFSRARSLELTTIENLEYKIFFRLEYLRGRGKSRKSLKHLASL